MDSKRLRVFLAIISAVAGVVLITTGPSWQAEPLSFVNKYAMEFGAFAFLLVPWLLRWYNWMAIQLGLTVAYLVWFYLDKL